MFTVLPNFQKVVRGGGAGVNFSMKNKLNSEIFSNKKAGKQKFFFSVRTKNSNWEI